MKRMNVTYDKRWKHCEFSRIMVNRHDYFCAIPRSAESITANDINYRAYNHRFMNTFIVTLTTTYTISLHVLSAIDQPMQLPIDYHVWLYRSSILLWMLQFVVLSKIKYCKNAKKIIFYFYCESLSWISRILVGHWLLFL